MLGAITYLATWLTPAQFIQSPLGLARSVAQHRYFDQAIRIHTAIGRRLALAITLGALLALLAMAGAGAQERNKGRRIHSELIASAVQASLVRALDTTSHELVATLKDTSRTLRRIRRATPTGALLSTQAKVQLQRHITAIAELRPALIEKVTRQPGSQRPRFAARVQRRFEEVLATLRAIHQARTPKAQGRALSEARKALRQWRRGQRVESSRRQARTAGVPNIPAPRRYVAPPFNENQPTVHHERPVLRDDDSKPAPPPRHARARRVGAFDGLLDGHTLARFAPARFPAAQFTTAGTDGAGFGPSSSGPSGSDPGRSDLGRFTPPARFITVGQPPATPSEAATCDYTAADLGRPAATVHAEVAVTPDIAALAQSLGYSPVRIIEYVSNEIDFEAYFGSLKGAQGALISGAANATDHASLTLALLRASNIPARYVKGQVAFYNDERLYRWLGARSATGAAALLASGQIPTSRSGDNVFFTQVWVEACIPYRNYRGSGANNRGHRWVPIDTAFKNRAYQDGIAIDVSFDYASYLSTRTLLLPHEQFEAQVQAHIRTLAPRYGNNTLADVPYTGRTEPLTLDILPATLPYEVRQYLAWDGTATAETAALPAKHRYTLSIDVGNAQSNATLGHAVLDVPAIALKRLTLAFQPGTGGSLDAERRAYLRQLEARYGPGSALYIQRNGAVQCVRDHTPVLKVDGAAVNLDPTSAPTCYFALNEWYGGTTLDPNVVRVDRLPKRTLSLEVQLGGATLNATRFDTLSAFDYHALHLYSHQTSERLIQARAARLLEGINNTPDPAEDKEATLGEFLHLVGLKYLHYIADAYHRVGRLYGESGQSGLHIGLTASRTEVSYLFDLPYAVTNSGFLIDVPGGQSRSTHLETGRTSFEAFVLGGYALSALESYVWQENARMDAVSAVRGLQFANDSGIEVLDINAANQATEWPKLQVGEGALDYSQATKNTLQGLLNSGHDIKIPVSLIDYGEWTGQIYVATRQSGNRLSATYKIGPFAGGYTVNRTPSAPTYRLPARRAGAPGASTPTALAPATLNSMINYGTTHGTSRGGDPVNMATGNLFDIEQDLRVMGRGGLPISFQRTYNSLAAAHPNASTAPLGYGWTHSFNHFLTFEDSDGDADVEGSDEDTLTSSVTWTTGDGGQRFIPVAGAAGGVAIGAAFTPPQGFYFAASREPDGRYRIREKNGFSYFFENVPGTVGQTARVLRLEDRNGNGLRFDYGPAGTLDTVTDDLDRVITLLYDSAHRLTHLRDWTYPSTGREWRYHYNADGELERVDNPLAASGQQPGLTYEYYGLADGVNLNHALRRSQKPNGNGMTFEYYSNGRVLRHTDDRGGTLTFTDNDYRREATTTNERGFVKRYFFNENGSPTLTIDENGGRMAHTYDPLAPFHEIARTDAAGLTTRYDYDANGNVTRITAPSGATTEYSHFNAFAQAMKVKDANGNITLHQSDAAGNITQTLVLKANTGAHYDPATWEPVPAAILSWTQQTFDAHGNPLIIKRIRDFQTQQGPTAEFDYTDTANATSGLNPVTVRRCGDLDGDARIERSTECRQVTQSYDALGRPTASIDDNWYRSEHHYDRAGRLVLSTDTQGWPRRYRFDANGNMTGHRLTVTTPGGTPAVVDQSRFLYDALDRPVQSIDAGGFVTRSEYDALGNLTAVVDADGFRTSIDYDALNRAVRVYDEEGHAVVRDYDAIGRVRSITDPNGHQIQHTYYGAAGDGRLRRRTSPLNRYVDFEYDAVGRVTRVVDHLGRDTHTQYDALGRVVRVAGPLHNAAPDLPAIRPVTTYRYNALGNRVQIAAGHTPQTSGTNAGADLTTVQQINTYDDFGRKLSQTDANGNTWTFTYDLHDNLITLVDPKGQRVERDYAYGGYVTERRAYRHASDATPHTTRYTRNALGQVTQVEAPEVTYSYRYDTAHRLVRQADHRGGKSIEYHYSAGGLLNTMGDGEGHLTQYLYDPVGRLATIWAPNGTLVNFGYDAAGRLTERWFDNGLATRYHYNADDTLSRLVNRRADGSQISSHAYSYNAAGLRDTYAQTLGGATRERRYTYDPLDRLTQVTDATDDSLIGAYTYDVYGNRATQDNGDGVRTYTYDAAHQLLTIDSGASTDMGYEYDDNGNLTRQLASGVLPVLTLNYDALDRLSSAELDDGSLETYQYDPGGRRIEKRQGAATERFIYSGANLVADYGGTWTQAAGRYTHAGIDNPLIHTDANGASQFYQQDGLGSVVAMTDAAGTLLGAHQYDAWGTVVTRSGHLQRFGYTGREADATGLLYYRARYYDPGTGRFTQRDPLGFVDGVNQYAYAANNPVMFVDPFGTVATGSIHNNSTAQRTSYEKRPSFWDRVSSAAPQLLSAAAGTAGIPYAESGVLTLFGRHEQAEQAEQAAIEETALRLGGAAVGAGIGALGLGVGAAPGALIGQQVVKMANSARRLYGIVRGIFKGTCSFPAGTPVLTEQGLVPIESLPERGLSLFTP
ncbi:MAG: hypothetical protein GKR94_14185 [Gammaproteobacteria bacterium]|nr:hypothetical protein [Gammaproteobacteria bacterium]